MPSRKQQSSVPTLDRYVQPTRIAIVHGTKYLNRSLEQLLLLTSCFQRYLSLAGAPSQYATRSSSSLSTKPMEHFVVCAYSKLSSPSSSLVSSLASVSSSRLSPTQLPKCSKGFFLRKRSLSPMGKLPHCKSSHSILSLQVHTNSSLTLPLPLSYSRLQLP